MNTPSVSLDPSPELVQGALREPELLQRMESNKFYLVLQSKGRFAFHRDTFGKLLVSAQVM
jgi:hypothetical protein